MQSAHRAARPAQMHVAALREAYEAAVAAEGDAQGNALQLFGELGQRVAASYAGFMAGAAAALLQIVKGGIDYALQVTLPPQNVYCGCLGDVNHRSSEALTRRTKDVSTPALM